MPVEESECANEYGIDYNEYMDDTPRWLAMPKGAGSK